MRRSKILPEEHITSSVTPKVKEHPVNFPLYLQIPPNKRVNFADSGSNGLLGSRQLIKKITIETGNREAAWLLENLYGKPSDIFRHRLAGSRRKRTASGNGIEAFSHSWAGL